MNLKKLLLAVCLAAVSTAGMAQKSFNLKLWEGKMPGKGGAADDVPELKVYLPAEKKATGRAVVICPGGAYHSLAMEHEGTDWAPFFNDMGIAVAVLKYRMPHGHADLPVLDAEEAMRVVRRNARAWHVDATDVGIMGFSAGGHLASTLAVHSKGDAKPDFQVLFYPVITMMPAYTHLGSHDNLLGKDARKKDEQHYSNDMHVTRLTPRACIILSDDDDVVQPANAINYYTELYRHDVPASLFIYPSGGHGYGLRSSFSFHAEMLLNLRAWLNSF